MLGEAGKGASQEAGNADGLLRVSQKARPKDRKMDRRDQELLDKQLWGASRPPARDGGNTAAGFILTFLTGLAIGGILFAPQEKQVQIASYDRAAVISPNSPLSTLR
jgi:hypothetical protein